MDWTPDRVLVYRKSETPKPATGPERTQRIGIWDLNASAGSLPRVLDALEDAQEYFSFYSVEAPFQIGLTTPGDHVAAEWKHKTGRSMSPDEAALNVRASPIFTAARPILDALPIEWLVVVVDSMIADESNPADAWYNLFATTSGHLVLLSTSDLREFAAEAGRPFESAIAGTALSMVLLETVPGLVRTPGTIFDFCENRHDIVKLIRTPKIDAWNRRLIPAEILEPTDRILEVLASYTGNTTPAQIRRAWEVLKKNRATTRKKTLATTKRPAATFKSLLSKLTGSLPAQSVKKRTTAKSRSASTAKKALKRR